MTSKEEIKILSKEEIIQRLKDMVVDNENVYPWKWFSFIVMNPDYNPSEFSQEIEDSEERIDEWAEVNKEMKKPDIQKGTAPLMMCYTIKRHVLKRLSTS